MTSRLNPYLSFRDNARDAMQFYQTVFGGQLSVSTFGEYGMAQDPSESGKVMHAQLEAPNGYWLMGADTPNSMPYQPGTNIAISLSGGSDTDGELRGFWDKLADGGRVNMPLSKAEWGDTFGMLTDRFGINWLVNIAGQHQQQ